MGWSDFQVLVTSVNCHYTWTAIECIVLSAIRRRWASDLNLYTERQLGSLLYSTVYRIEFSHHSLSLKLKWHSQIVYTVPCRESKHIWTLLILNSNQSIVTVLFDLPHQWTKPYSTLLLDEARWYLKLCGELRIATIVMKISGPLFARLMLILEHRFNIFLDKVFVQMKCAFL